jgi:predicted O-linked N-acetylglucosamine transferase (SPINDLY family)
VFASFNQAYKITPAVFDLWCRLLREVPGSVLWLLEWNPASTKNLRAEAERRAVDPRRLVVAPQMPQVEHLGRLQNADLVLDTRPVNGHTTVSDALWTGVPVVTHPGEAFVSRVAGSILTALGLQALIATSEEDYVRIARELATDPKRLARVKRQIEDAKRTSPFFDCETYTRDLEALYRHMWRRYTGGREPVALGIDGIIVAD